ncbi:MAG TPA: DUF4162 domain-containing protein, partial [Bacteroidia bacterium]|nr:DUF4162 domain-containing protein [Bacteroidia bacterium]
RGATIILSTHNMGSVEELCDNIALINKGKKILDGNVKEIRRAYAARTYDIQFKGSMIAFSNAMWTGAEFISKSEGEAGIQHARIKLLGNTSSNTILENVIRAGEVVGFTEVLPTMNDIFIMKVQENSEEVPLELIGTKSNFTE